jgi:phytoene dehydrogenase-like protein
MALASPFFAEFDLPARGVQLAVPDIAYANPLPDRPAAIAYRDLARTCAELDDGGSWRRLLGPLVTDWAAMISLLLGDKRSAPGALLPALRLGLRTLAQGTPAWGSLAGDDSRALFSGVAAHAITPLPSLASAGAGLMLATLAHAVGWPIPVGGTQAISDALIADLRAHGGELTAGIEVTSPPGPPGSVVVFDTAPTALLRVYGDALPSQYAKALRRYRYGSGAATKVDFVLSDDIPWSDPRLREAPTLHLGGTREQMARAEADVAAGRHAQWPMVLASSPHAADPGRIDAEGRRPFWTYAHVPAGSTVDATEAVTAVVERFAPGFRDVVVAARAVPAARLADHNANYVGGDISVGSNTVWHAFVGPTPRVNPWRTAIPKVYLCSAATPPGPGVHGMCGYYAARTLLRREFGINSMPRLEP